MAILSLLSMVGTRIPADNPFLTLMLVAVLAFPLLAARGRVLAQQPPGPAPRGATSPPPPKKDDSDSVTNRTKKLILKDGTYQLVREYQRNGERVRYFSSERGDWEELPAAMIDWDATARDEAEANKTSQAMVEKIHRSEEAKKMEPPLDVDVSLPVAEGVYLPGGEGLFVVEGKSVRLLEQVGSNTKTDTLRSIGQVLSPIPIVPGKVTVTIPGARAGMRLRTTTPEFYLREAPPDPEAVSSIHKSSRPGENGPDVVLVRAKVTHGSRQLESISTLFGEEMSKNRNEVSLQRWEVAQGLYRFTLGESLAPGEYAIAEVLSDGLNYFVWDFGVDGMEDKPKKK
ncbi:MAG TPA: hypothetical protein VEI49_02420 [Terriglobales bacterium]|nr:hypothetical protein [Terriglobales bacterium]